MRKVQLMNKSVVVSILAVSLACGASAIADTSTKVGGFVDAGYNWTNAATNNTFGINDGAVYYWGMVDSTEFMLDLPFSFAGAGNANFNFAQTKAQAYVGHTFDFGLHWRLGQFDKLYGYEKNDTVDVRYAKQGLIYNNMMPKVHVGWNADYSFDPFSIGVLIANPRDKGQMGNNIPDYGVTLGFKSEMVYLNFGWLQEQNNGGSTSNTLWDIVLGGHYNSFSAAFEAAFLKNASSGTGTGYLLDLGYDCNDRWGIGARGELLSRVGGNHQIAQVTVGPSLKVSKALTMKLDYSLKGTQALAGNDAHKDHSVDIEGVYRF